MSDSTKNLSMPKVAILMCTYNGEKFLKEQIESILNQSFKKWTLYISDDGSSDKTIEIVLTYKKLLGKKIILFKGPQKGFVLNFLGICHSFSADFYFWCDQDDVWHRNKIQRALNWLQKQSPLIPSLYCGRSYLSDSHNKIIGLSPLFKKAPTFKNAIIQNVGSGNTMAFNNAARKLLTCFPKENKIITHDWLLYQLVTAFKGEVFYDKVSFIYYRQHGNNLIGMPTGFKALFRHLQLILNGTIKKWNISSQRYLSTLDNLPTSSRLLINELIDSRQKSRLEQILTYKKLGIYRQSFFGQCALFISILIGKF